MTPTLSVSVGGRGAGASSFGLLGADAVLVTGVSVAGNWDRPPQGCASTPAPGGQRNCCVGRQRTGVFPGLESRPPIRQKKPLRGARLSGTPGTTAWLKKHPNSQSTVGEPENL